MQEKEYTWCFACGKDNPIGLKMEFTMDAEECVAYFTPRQEHQSYDGRMHGGLISVLLDEIMGHYLFVTEGKPAYTAKMELRYRHGKMCRPAFETKRPSGRNAGPNNYERWHRSC